MGLREYAFAVNYTAGYRSPAKPFLGPKESNICRKIPPPSLLADNTILKWRTAVNKKKFLGVSITVASLLFAWFTIHFAPNAEGQSAAGCTDQALALAEGQLTDTIAYTSTSSFPVETNPSNGNKWILSDASHWTSGFFPGWMWFMYEKTLSDTWLTRAQQQTATMQGQDTNAIDHDIGFKM